jgi:hypothetical protein
MVVVVSNDRHGTSRIWNNINNSTTRRKDSLSFLGGWFVIHDIGIGTTILLVLIVVVVVLIVAS